MYTFVCSLEGEYVLLWHNPVSVNNGLPHFIVTIANSKGGGMGGVSFVRCAILIGPQTHSFQHFSALAKGLGGFGSKDPDFQHFPFLKSKDQGFYYLAAHSP